MAIEQGCRRAASWCDLELTFDLAVVTLTFKILSGLYLRATVKFRMLILVRDIGKRVQVGNVIV